MVFAVTLFKKHLQQTPFLLLNLTHGLPFLKLHLESLKTKMSQPKHKINKNLLSVVYEVIALRFFI